MNLRGVFRFPAEALRRQNTTVRSGRENVSGNHAAFFPLV
jgi:hypothetical protein